MRGFARDPGFAGAHHALKNVAIERLSRRHELININDPNKMPSISEHRSNTLPPNPEAFALKRDEKQEEESGDTDPEERPGNDLLKSIIALSNLPENPPGESAGPSEPEHLEAQIREKIFNDCQGIIEKIASGKDSGSSRNRLPIKDYLLGGGLLVDAYSARGEGADLRKSYLAVVQAEQRRPELLDGRDSTVNKKIFDKNARTVNEAVADAKREFSTLVKAASDQDGNRVQLKAVLGNALDAIKDGSGGVSVSQNVTKFFHGASPVLSGASPITSALGGLAGVVDLALGALEVDQARARSEQISRFKQRIKEALISEATLDQVDRSLVTRIADHCEKYRQDARTLADWDRTKGGVRIGSASAMILGGVAAALAVPGASIVVAVLGTGYLLFDVITTSMVDARKNEADQRHVKNDLNAELQTAHQAAGKPADQHGNVKETGTTPDTTQQLILDIARKIQSGDKPLEKFLLELGVPQKVLDAVHVSKSMSTEMIDLLRYSLFDANLSRPREADYKKIISDATGKDVAMQRNALLSLRKQLGPDRQHLMKEIHATEGKKAIVAALLGDSQGGQADVKRKDTWSYYLGKGSQCTDLRHANFSKTRFTDFWNKDEKFRTFVVRALGQTAKELGKDYTALAPDFDKVVRDEEHVPDNDAKMALTAYHLYRHIRDSQSLCESWLSSGNFDDITHYSSGKFDVKNGQRQPGVTGVDIKRQAAAFLAREKLMATYKEFSKPLLDIYPVVNEIRKFASDKVAIDAQLMAKIVTLFEKNPGKRQEISQELVKHIGTLPDNPVSNWDKLAQDFVSRLGAGDFMAESGLDALKKVQLNTKAYENLRGHAGSQIGDAPIFAFEKYPAYSNKKYATITAANAKTVLRERWLASRQTTPPEEFEQLLSVAEFAGQSKAISRWEGFGAWFKRISGIKSIGEFFSWIGSLFTGGLFSGAGTLAQLGPDGKHLKNLIEAKLKGDFAPVEGSFREKFIAEALFATNPDVRNFMKTYLEKRNLPTLKGERRSVEAKLVAYRKFDDQKNGARLLATALCRTDNAEGVSEAAREYGNCKWLAYSKSCFTDPETGERMRGGLEALFLMVRNRSLGIEPVVQIIEVILGRRNALTVPLPPDIDLSEGTRSMFDPSSIALYGLRDGNAHSVRDRAKRAVSLLKEEGLNPGLVFDRLWMKDAKTVSKTPLTESDRAEWKNRFTLYKDALRSGFYPQEHDAVVEWEIGAMLLGMKPGEAKRMKALEWAKGPRYLVQPGQASSTKAKDTAERPEELVLRSMREDVLQSVRDYIRSNANSPYWSGQDIGNTKLIAHLNRTEKWDFGTMSTSELRTAMSDESSIESAKLLIRLELIQANPTMYSAEREDEELVALAKEAGDKRVTDPEFEMAFSACRIELDRIRSDGRAEADKAFA